MMFDLLEEGCLRAMGKFIAIAFKCKSILGSTRSIQKCSHLCFYIGSVHMKILQVDRADVTKAEDSFDLVNVSEVVSY